MTGRGRTAAGRRCGAVAGIGLLVAGCAASGDGGWAGAGMWSQGPPLRMPALPAGVRLVGLEGGTVRSLLGQPNVARAEKQAQFWRYDLGRCQLDLFLYTDPRTGQQRVAYLDVRPSGSTWRPTGCADVARRLRVAALAPEPH